MAYNSIIDFSSIINQQVNKHEILIDYLTRAEALALVAANDNFYDQSEEICSNYLQALHYFILQAITIQKSLLNDLMPYWSNCVTQEANQSKMNHLFLNGHKIVEKAPNI